MRHLKRQNNRQRALVALVPMEHGRIPSSIEVIASWPLAVETAQMPTVRFDTRTIHTGPPELALARY